MTPFPTVGTAAELRAWVEHELIDFGVSILRGEDPEEIATHVAEDRPAFASIPHLELARAIRVFQMALPRKPKAPPVPKAPEQLPDPDAMRAALASMTAMRDHWQARATKLESACRTARDAIRASGLVATGTHASLTHALSTLVHAIEQTTPKGGR